MYFNKDTKRFYLNKIRIVKKEDIEYVILVDLETSNDDKTFFDCSIRVVNIKTGLVVARYSFVLIESWLTKDVINGCYSKKKKKAYKKMLESGKYEFITREELNDLLNKLIKEYHIQYFSAFNGAFDLESIYRTLDIERPRTKWFKFSILKKYECLFKTLHLIDIGTLCYIWYDKEDYANWYDKEIAIYNKDGTRKVNVEVLGRYVLKDKFFNEEHTGQSDLDIEQQLLINAFNHPDITHIAVNLPMLWGARILATKKLKENTITYQALYNHVVLEKK